MTRYPWPASAINADDMATLFRVRENGANRIPITQLIARAVRETYGRQAEPRLVVLPQPQNQQQKEAA